MTGDDAGDVGPVPISVSWSAGGLVDVDPDHMAGQIRVGEVHTTIQHGHRDPATGVCSTGRAGPGTRRPAIERVSRAQVARSDAASAIRRKVPADRWLTGTTTQEAAHHAEQAVEQVAHQGYAWDDRDRPVRRDVANVRILRQGGDAAQLDVRNQRRDDRKLFVGAAGAAAE